MAIGVGLVIVVLLITTTLPGHGWMWPPVLLALLLGCAVAKALG
jgi:hypothetical protein